MSRPPRLNGCPYVGLYRYFLTFCTFNRRPVFVDACAVEIVSAKLRQCSGAERIAIDAYCAMPDHVHLLATGLTATSDLKRFVGQSKQRSAWTFKNEVGQRLWQEGYFDHVLREEDDVAAVIAYIVNNPIRAGLVKSAEEYPFWGSFTHSREEILDFVADVPDWKAPR